MTMNPLPKLHLVEFLIFFNSPGCEMTAVCIALHTVKPSFHKDWNNMPHMGLQLMMTLSMIMIEVTI